MAINKQPIILASYVGSIVVVLIWFIMVLTQIINQGTKKKSYLEIPNEHQYLIGITLWYPCVSYLTPFLMLIIDIGHIPMGLFMIGVHERVVQALKKYLLYFECTYFNMIGWIDNYFHAYT